VGQFELNETGRAARGHPGWVSPSASETGKGARPVRHAASADGTQSVWVKPGKALRDGLTGIGGSSSQGNGGLPLPGLATSINSQEGRADASKKPGLGG
jgi:hypothetical protein